MFQLCSKHLKGAINKAVLFLLLALGVHRPISCGTMALLSDEVLDEFAQSGGRETTYMHIHVYVSLLVKAPSFSYGASSQQLSSI